MDQWRTFFGKAGADLWTIIEQAIILAATDHPDEFKDKRCDIAEALFARKPRHLISGDTDATRLSESVVTNGTNCVKKKERRDDKHTQRPVRIDHSDHDEAEAFNEELEDEMLIMQEVDSIKETLMDSEQSDIVILDSLQKLEHLPMTVAALKATEIGKQVNNLRKHSSKAVRSLVRQLVRTWKEVVDEWAKSAGDVPAVAVGAPIRCVSSERDVKEQGLTSPLLDESTLFLAGGTKKVRSQFLNCMDDEMIAGYRDIYCQEDHLDSYPPSISSQVNYCDHDLKVLARHDDWEAPEEMGSSSRVELPGLGRLQKMEKKPQLIGRGPSSKTVEDKRSMHHFGAMPILQSSTAGSGPGRPFIGVSKHDSTTVSEVQITERLETAKRKLYEGYQQADYAKRQRTVSLLNLPDLPKGGPIQGKIVSSGQNKVASQSWHQDQSIR